MIRNLFNFLLLLKAALEKTFHWTTNALDFISLNQRKRKAILKVRKAIFESEVSHV